ncbi:MAG TPA: fimbria/pilus outer membrane usher protein, partial [Burkholderiales bacterium]|nr:fimbria/pilus outer membrane usher protein [Burkholderiales bacterium]
SGHVTRGGEALPLQLAVILRALPATTGTPEADIARLVDPASVQLVFYSVRLNQQELGVARLLKLPDGRWFARRADLEEWRLRIPASPPLLFRNEEHYALDAFEGVAYRIDAPLQAMDLEVAPRYFAATQLDGAAARAAPPVLPSPGGVVNYDFFLNAESGAKRLDGLFETVLFNRLGVATSGFLAQDVTADPGLVRLETAWRRDFPAEMKTLIIGDAIGSSGIWGRPVRFGGVRWGTNFAINPNFVAFPQPGITGEAALPTTTELYVDGVLRQRSNVPPGPFRIDNVPVVTGQGEVRMVVRDILGREQVINVPYYASTQLLREGLAEDSYELGAVRNDFGIRSHHYGRAVAAIQRRRGFSDRLTGEARAEVLRDQQTAGGGASVAVPDVAVFTGAGALSRSERGIGALLFAGFERQVWRGVSAGLRSQWTSPDFAQLGVQPGERAPVRLLSANIGFSPAGMGSFGAAYVRQDNRDRANTEIVSGSYNVNVSPSSALIVFALKPLRGEGGAVVGLTLAVGFDARRSGSVNYTAQPGTDQAYAQLQQNLPTGTGTGYRLLAGTGDNGGRQEVGFAYQNDVGTYGVEVGRAEHRTAFRASARGAVAVLDGRPFLSRTLDQSFAVAHIPGFPDVAVYVNNQIVARTDAAGYAMLPQLQPYQANAVRIDTGDLPMDTRIAGGLLDAVPYYRSGLLLRFSIERANGALLVLKLEDGSDMPAGSVVTVAGRSEEFPVAHRGQVYVTGLDARNRLRATWRGQSCEFDLEPGVALGTQPTIGPIRCAGVKP